MRLFDAIIDANQRATRGEEAGLRPGDFADPWHTQLYTVIRERSVARLDAAVRLL